MSWQPDIVLIVVLTGVLGATFSAVQSVIGSRTDPIPDVGSKYITLSRAWCAGAIAALAGYALFGSGLINVKVGDNGLATWLAVAFLFGYAGERPISRIAETIAGKADNTKVKPPVK